MIGLTSFMLSQNMRNGPGETNVVKPIGAEDVVGHDAGVPQGETGRNVLTFPADWNAIPMFDFPDDEPDHGNETDNGAVEDAERSESSVSQPESDEEEGDPNPDSREETVSARDDTSAIVPCKPGAVTNKYSLRSRGLLL
jgi:hypothetical protein